MGDKEILVRKPKWQTDRVFGRCRHKWENNIKEDLTTDWECVTGFIWLTQRIFSSLVWPQ